MLNHRVKFAGNRHANQKHRKTRGEVNNSSIGIVSTSPPSLLSLSLPSLSDTPVQSTSHATKSKFKESLTTAGKQNRGKRSHLYQAVRDTNSLPTYSPVWVPTLSNRATSNRETGKEPPTFSLAISHAPFAHVADSLPPLLPIRRTNFWFS